MAFTFKNLRDGNDRGQTHFLRNAEVEYSKAGKECIVTFTQEMNLQGGEYLLSFGCTGYKGGEFTVFHRLL